MRCHHYIIICRDIMILTLAVVGVFSFDLGILILCLFIRSNRLLVWHWMMYEFQSLTRDVPCILCSSSRKVRQSDSTNDGNKTQARQYCAILQKI